MRAVIGSLALIIYLIAYVALAVTLGGSLPQAWPVLLLFYAAAGVLWVFPLRPLMNWMSQRS